jgi:hypothetical protein
MTVAFARTRSTRALAWPALALAGVALLTPALAQSHQPRRPGVGRARRELDLIG